MMWWITGRMLRFVDPGRASSPGHTDEPIRAELFSPDRLESHAETLAAAQAVADERWPAADLPGRSRDNGEKLVGCYHLIAEAARQDRAITPAGEWLLDNFHVVEEQGRELDRGLTPRYCAALPRLAGGPLAGFPRAYGLAWAFVAHTDSRFDAGLLRRFVKAYQRVDVLAIREVWAVPLLLRCVLLENLRRICVRMAASQEERLQADTFADELLALGPQSTALGLAALRTPEGSTLASAFAVQLIQRLRYQDVSLQWLNEGLAASGREADATVQSEHAVQSASNLSVQNIITSMRAISAFDWPGWFEDVSVVDDALREHAGFAAMDFSTRDRYRHAVEELALGAGKSEVHVARAVVANAARPRHGPAAFEDRHADPGYYLISTGRIEFERELGYRPPLRKRMLRAHVEHAATVYFGGIALIALALLAWPLAASVESGATLGGLALLGLLGLFPASDVAVTLLNRLVTLWIGPRHLPRLQLADGVPDTMRTFVAVPVLLGSEESIREQVERLESHFLANPAGDVGFALLSDWTDSNIECTAEDEQLLRSARAGIDALNARHGTTVFGPPVPPLPPAPAMESGAAEMDGVGAQARQAARVQPPAARARATPLSWRWRGVRRKRRAACAMSSPWTRTPDCRSTRCAAWSALPRIPSTSPASISWHSAWWRATACSSRALRRRCRQRARARCTSASISGASGLDPYAGAVSDVYQDLFGEGNFTGKGIYDVDAFEASLAGRIPENAVLSHDLFEGIFARCGLVSDLDVFEDFPSHSEVAAVRTASLDARRLATAPLDLRTAGAAQCPHWAAGRWLDNLRRSLSAPAALATLLASWSMPFAPHAAWIAFVLFCAWLPGLAVRSWPACCRRHSRHLLRASLPGRGGRCPGRRAATPWWR